MKISNLTVDGFGVWSGLELNSLSPGLNVFYGPNEAGKTTLMNFVRALFFGFSAERAARYLPPLSGGRAGGTTQLSAGESSFVVSRHTDPAGQAEYLVVSRDNRQAVDGQQTLAALLGEVDESTFNNVFVFGLQEIQELATLGDTRAAAELYGLALGLDRVSLVDVLGELKVSRERLLAADERPSLISQLLAQRQQLAAELDEAAQSTGRYLTLSAERQRLDSEMEGLSAEHERCEQQARRIALARSLQERWQRRGMLGEQLRLLGNVDTLPADALVRFDEIDARLKLYGRRLRRIKQQRGELREQIGKLRINDLLSRHALRVEALAEQQPWIGALEKRIRELEEGLLELESQNEDARKQWAVGGSHATLSKRSVDELRRAAREMQAARRQAKQVHEQSAAAEKLAEEVRRRVDESLGRTSESLGKNGNRGLTEALAEAGELVSILRKRVQLDERLTQMTARQSELEEQGHESLEQQILPTWALAGLGGLFVIGCALILLFLVGMVLPGTLGDSIGWPVGLIGVGAVAASGLLKFSLDRGAETRVDRTHHQLQALTQQIKDAQEQRDELDEQLPRGGGPLVSRLQAAEKQLAKLEELMPLQSEREATIAAARKAHDQTQSIRDRCRDTRKRWKRLLAQNGLPEDLSPSQLKHFARGRRQSAGLEAAIADQKAELGRRRIEYDSLVGRVTQLVGQVGITPKSDRPLERLQQCVTELADQQSVLKQREELQKQIARLKPRYQKALKRRNRLRRQRVALLRSAGTLDELEFRRRASLLADALRLRNEHAQLDHEITAALSSQEEEPVAEWLAGGQNLDLLEAHANEARRAAAARLSEASERRGELNHRLKVLAEDRQAAEKQLELQIIDKRLADALDRWRVLAVCNLLLVGVRDYYEREHQPQVLREASGYLKRLTGGRYTRVWTPIGQHVLRIDDREGQVLGIEVLSSGTREQLLLALRMALASSFARRGIELPLVLDDVLVNFDVTRARAAAMVLRDFAKDGHQVLVFTCHEHIAKLFRNLKAEVRNLPDRTRVNVVEEPLPPPVEAEPVPEPEPVAAEVPPAPPEPVLAEPELIEPEIVEPEPVEPIIEQVFEPEPVIEEAEIEVIEVEAIVEPEPIVEVIAEPVVETPPPPPPVERKPAPRKRRRRAIQRWERQRWSAEEFDGELADRVRGDLLIEEDVEPELADEHAA